MSAGKEDLQNDLKPRKLDHLRTSRAEKIIKSFKADLTRLHTNQNQINQNRSINLIQNDKLKMIEIPPEMIRKVHFFIYFI